MPKEIEFLVYRYPNHEAYQHGHGEFVGRTKNEIDAIHAAKNSFHDRTEIMSITLHNHPALEGFSASLQINYTERGKEFTMDDFWICPDPNYRGEKDNSYWGTIGDWKAEKQQEEPELD